MISVKSLSLFHILIFLAFILPTGVRNIFRAGSDSSGLLIFSAIAIFFFMVKRYRIKISASALLHVVYWIFMLQVALIIHSLLALIFNESFDLVRWSMSVFITFPIIFSAIILWCEINTISEVEFDYIIRVLFCFMLFVGYLGALTFSDEMGAGKRLILFSEPSHFALVITPLLAYFCIVSKNNYKILALIAIFCLGLLIQNLTIFVGIFLTSSLYVRWNKLLIISLLLLCGMLFFEHDLERYSYYLDRLSFIYGVEYTDNLTALSFLQGWQFIVESMKNYFPFGLGFQQLGSADLAASATSKLDSMGFDLNRNDGSFLASKIISEFGIIGILLIGAYITIFFKKYSFLRKNIMTKQIYNLPSKTIFFDIIYISFSMTLFIRGSGYFTTTVFIFLLAIINFFIMSLYSNKKN